MSRKAKSRILHSLETAGLITAERRGGTRDDPNLRCSPRRRGLGDGRGRAAGEVFFSLNLFM